MDRISKGLKLYLKGKVILDFDQDDLILFLVQGTNDQYMVSFLDGVIRCDCPDYTNRWQKDHGSFMCKHIWASIFKLISLKFFNSFFKKLEK